MRRATRPSKTAIWKHWETRTCWMSLAGSTPPVVAITFIAWARDQEVMVPWTRVHDARTMDLFRNRLKDAQRPRIGINTLNGHR